MYTHTLCALFVTRFGVCRFLIIGGAHTSYTYWRPECVPGNDVSEVQRIRVNNFSPYLSGPCVSPMYSFGASMHPACDTNSFFLVVLRVCIPSLHGMHRSCNACSGCASVSARFGAALEGKKEGKSASTKGVVNTLPTPQFSLPPRSCLTPHPSVPSPCPPNCSYLHPTPPARFAISTHRPSPCRRHERAHTLQHTHTDSGQHTHYSCMLGGGGDGNNSRNSPPPPSDPSPPFLPPSAPSASLPSSPAR